jgi:hypothetical protein
VGFNNIAVNSITGNGGDLKLNATASGETIYIGHDTGSVVVNLGSGVTSLTFAVSSNGTNSLTCNSTNVVTTKNNTLDNGSGQLTVSSGINFPTSGGTPTLLNYYEEYNYTSTFTGCGLVTSAVAIHITRIGRIVTLSTQLDVNWTCVSYGTMVTTTAFPSRFGVNTNHNHFITSVVNNGTPMPADAYISISNTVFVSGNGSSSNFQGNCSIYRFSTTWSI